jgi:hypothetical protein
MNCFQMLFQLSLGAHHGPLLAAFLAPALIEIQNSDEQL